MDDKELTIDMGTLYDINKNLVLNNCSDLTEGELNSKKIIMKDWIKNAHNRYFMLLCNEAKDYTVFDCKEGQELDMAECILFECLPNRAYTIRGIDITDNKDAIEIWVTDSQEAYVYYLFPDDIGVVAFDDNEKEDDNKW